MKFLIVGLHASGKQEVLDTLSEMDIKCGKLFSNIDNPSPDIYNSFNYDIFTTSEVNEVFENNAYIFINELDKYSNVNSYKYFEGLTKYEFDNNDNWDHLEEICKAISGKEDIWYATNMEICEYVKAYESLSYSADGKLIYNPTLFTIWLIIDNKPST